MARTRVIVEWSTIQGGGEVIAWVGRLDDGEFVIALEPPMELSVTPPEPPPVTAGDLMDGENDPQVGSLVVDSSGMNATQRRLLERGSLLQQLVDEGRL